MIELSIFSFFAGVLTLLAPCILPLLPVIVGGGSFYDNQKPSVSLKHPLIITLSLITSVAVFTLLLKSTTALLGIPTSVWMLLSGGIIALFGINLLFPTLWEKIMLSTRLVFFTNKTLGSSQKQHGVKRDIFLGAALGPVFNSCSPTYALIVAAILPASFAAGSLYLAFYCLGLGAGLLLLSIFGRILIAKVKWMAQPGGLFQKILGIIFVIVGMGIILGLDKQLQTFVLDNGWYDPIERIEKNFTSGR